MIEQRGPLAMVLMGVTGCGKTTIGLVRAKLVTAFFASAYDYKWGANMAKMAAGDPLTDEDRAPWLATLHDLLAGWVADGKRGVLACSALKESYRETLSAGIAPGKLAFVWLDVPRAVLEVRLAARHHEYMNPVLLSSRLATLEPPADAVRVVNDHAPDEVAHEIVSRLALEA